ncbi:hypothetical protein ABT336_24845 [Micromonospora sp. NPDC000207]|uniref:hypothetical protein n=1 Tax=Micromonospora sp. NPDC000207 TaxID=3154246 RepID=UPI003324C1BD
MSERNHVAPGTAARRTAPTGVDGGEVAGPTERSEHTGVVGVRADLVSVVTA